MSGKENLSLFLSVCLSLLGSGSSAALHYVRCDCPNNYSHFDLLQEKTKKTKTKTKKQTHMQYASLLFHGFFFYEIISWILVCELR